MSRCSYEEVNNIFITLPVGYYIKRDVKRELAPTGMSYYLSTEDRLVISYSMIEMAINEIKNDEYNDNDKENVIRTLLYHEVSHAFLTPYNLYKDVSNSTERNVMNIFEDERIESILRNYYMNVNFRRMVYLLCGDPKDYPSPLVDVNEAFYTLVRYRKCPEKSFLDRVHRIIVEYKDLNRNGEGGYWYGGREPSYVAEVVKLYRDFKLWYMNELSNYPTTNDPSESSSPNEENNEKENEGDNGQNTPTMNDENEENNESNDSSENESDEETSSEESDDGEGDSSEDSDENESNENKNSSGESEEESDEETDDGLVSEDEKDESFGKDDSPFKPVTNEFYDNKMIEDINNILNMIKNTQKRNGSAINSYSGVFDPRSVVREDYKYFLQSNRSDHSKMFSKVKLNLFIDRSGSFYDNEELVNKLIYALSTLEKSNKDFQFDLITMGEGERIENRNNRKLSCSGCNYLDSDIFRIFKSVQSTNCSNYNIVLFDGDAFSAGWSSNSGENFKAFNNKNTVVISDPDNERWINKYCVASRNIITRRYTQELYKNVISALSSLLR